MTQCLTIAPFPECGAFGTCLNNSTCVCSGGWSQSVEFAFFVDRLDPRFSASILPCDTSTTLLRIIYGSAALVSLGVLVFYVYSIRKFSQFKRLFLFLIGYSCYAVLSFYRLFNVDGIYAKDKLFSILFVFGFFCTNISSIIFLNKYVWYQEKTLPIHRAKNLQLIELVAKLERGMVLICFIAFGLNLAPVFLKNNRKAFISIKIVGSYLMSLLISDISALSNLGTVATMKMDFKSIIFKMKLVKYVTGILHCGILLACFLFVISDFGMTLMKYQFPIMINIGSVHASVVFLGFQSARNNKKKMQQYQGTFVETDNGGILIAQTEI
eukprot:snap_masked-scaffold_7-processed-gene-19.55-mRNA-1 protein AED:1.00 eAED:1.00 QI:0/0/0/0/1/1/2/0/325